MSVWAAKRFWADATVAPAQHGWTVQLDTRPLRTPAKVPLIVPTQALAQHIAQEWRAQDGVVKPETMPFTRSANSAIDSVTVQFDAVAQIVAAYGGSDLLCYRAETPSALVARQAADWGPLLEWAARDLAAPLRVGAGVMPVAQDPASLARLASAVAAFSAFELTALHDLVALSGSLILGLAVCAGRLTPPEAWALSRIDETWQADQWGTDEDAAATAALKREAFLHAARFYAYSKAAA